MERVFDKPYGYDDCCDGRACWPPNRTVVSPCSATVFGDTLKAWYQCPTCGYRWFTSWGVQPGGIAPNVWALLDETSRDAARQVRHNPNIPMLRDLSFA